MLYGRQNCPIEITFETTRKYDDPFNDVEVEVIFTEPDGKERIVPAFWAGDSCWKVRYASARVGLHRWRSVCSDSTNSDLNGREGMLEILPYEGNNPLFRHGRIRPSQNKHYLEHIDGTPFFWLADTWWMGLCKRLSFPEEFSLLTADRVKKGFSVIQIVAGLYPDMPAFDERGANEAGYPWEQGFTRINPSYFDMADLRLQHLIRSGLVPCIVGCWGYYLPWLGIEKMKKHWRYLIARYSAYPVIFCLAGEGIMPYYLSQEPQKESEFQKKGWTEIARYVRETDPFNNPITIHPTDSARNQVEDASLLDIDMLQTGHSDRWSIPNTIRLLNSSYSAEPVLPLINGEVCYEGIGEACRQEVQRFMFWVSFLSGACGHTYGANGIWQVNTKEKPYGPSPHGMSWGNTPWEDAYQLPGSHQLGLAKRFLERYQWWRFVPHQDWVEPAGTMDNWNGAYCAGIEGELRVIFLPSGVWGIKVKELEKNVRYRAFLFNPTNGEEIEMGVIRGDEKGTWQVPGVPPIFQDWVLVLSAQR
ncbi:DUF4038 domain-containing protein [bacterium]|nr:DUF4038 domain-containing protein [bacterium]